MDEFLKLRIELDDAITYGSTKLAKSLAKLGLQRAEEKKLLGEIEYFKGQLEIIDENFHAAIAHFDKVIEYNSNDGAAFNDRALCMVELGIIDEAFYYFDKGIEVEPDYAAIYHNKGWLLNKIGRHTEAIEYFKKALELQPRRAVTYENLADVYLNLSRYSDALEAYKNALDNLKPYCDNIRQQILSRIQLLEKKIKVKKLKS
ncbi:MAG: tetratricopeptide repeat protein [Candidatus Omnitrophota bacterium]